MTNIRVLLFTTNFLLLALFLTGCGDKRTGRAQSLYGGGDDASSIVYVCTGPSSKAYHTDEDCKGLDNCSKEVLEMTEQEAIDMGRHLCHYCKSGTDPY